MPENSVIFAGATGGPLCMYTVTPARNALTLGATNGSASMFSLYRQVFKSGLQSGWGGGIYPATAACPTFVALGPVYHFLNINLGTPAAVILASCTETCIMYGSETANAQIAKNAQAPGSFKNIQAAWKPWGPGVGIHVGRNILATLGLRVFCQPCTFALEKMTGKKNAFTQIGGDFCGNVLSACMTAPMHQLYGFMATSPELAGLDRDVVKKRMAAFLREQYTEMGNGKRVFKATLPRDLMMRSMYVATLYTLFVTYERAVIKCWPGR